MKEEREDRTQLRKEKRELRMKGGGLLESLSFVPIFGYNLV